MDDATKCPSCQQPIEIPEPDDIITLADGTQVAFYNGWEMPSVLCDLQKEVAEFLNVFDSDDFLDIFGDHAEVVLQADGTQRITEYDHD